MTPVNPLAYITLLATATLTLGACNTATNTWAEGDRLAYSERCNARFMEESGLEPEDLQRFCACTSEQLEREYGTYADYTAATLTEVQEREMFADCDYSW